MPPGRPADAQHRRMRIILGTLAAHRAHGVSRRALLKALGKDPGKATDQRILSRDLANLRDSGWRIDVEKVGTEDRYRLRVVDPRLRSAFSDGERAQLLRAARYAQLGQLFDALDPTSPPGPKGAEDTNLGLAVRAIELRALLHFEYAGKGRTLHPFDIELHPWGWRLRGLEEGTHQVKVFALERASDLDVDRPGTASPIPADLPPLDLDPMSRVEHAPLEVVVRHARDHTDEVRAQLGVGGHRTLTSVSDGLVDSVLTVTYVDSFLDRLLEMEQRVRLIGPDSVRRALRDRLLVALAPPVEESSADEVTGRRPATKAQPRLIRLDRDPRGRAARSPGRARTTDTHTWEESA